MVVARNKDVNALLCQQFSQRTVAKVYTALLCGHRRKMRIVEAAIAKIRPVSRACHCAPGTANRRVRAIGSLTAFISHGKERALALTRWRSPGDRAHHQLRIHCQLLGYPILGCDLYGGRELPGTEQAPRLMLHASELRFVHPVSHEPMHIQQASLF